MHSTDGRALRTTLMSSSSSGSGAGGAFVVAVEGLPSSCTWTRRMDATSGRCVVQPRSCYSCLNTKPTSDEICTLTPDGVCMGADAYDRTRDYRRGGPAAAWPPHLNFFPAQNATYCEKNDTACATCRERSFMNWEENPSQYCEGLGGCVCVAICESDSWEDAIQPALQKALLSDQANSSFVNCTIEEVKTAQDNVTVASNLSDFVGLGPTKSIYAGADQCMWVQNQTFCGAPRSCYDCLNTPIYSGARCMLHSSGYCTSMESYDLRKDFRYQGRSKNSVALFPSSNTSYCATSDATCLQCRQNQTFAQWFNVSSPPTFCVGNGGCVCVASCESPAWRNAVVELTCDTSAVQKFTQNERAYQISPVLYWSVSALSLIMAMVCALLGLSCVRRCQQRAAAERRRPRSPKGPTLELSGWKAMREKLIETEREFIGETGAMAKLEGRRLHATSADSEEPDSGPDSNRRDSSSVPVLLVEEGDAYRPASPSRMHQ